MRLERVKDRDIGVLHAQGIVGVDVITRTCIAWSSAAGSPPTAPAGSLAGLASSRLSVCCHELFRCPFRAISNNCLLDIEAG
jgi:hypothetical protein